MSKHTIEFVTKHYSFETMLDVGAGVGVDVGLAKERNPRTKATLVDLIPLKDRSVEINKNLGTWDTMNFLDFPEIEDESGRFDFVNCSHCLEHQLDLHSFIKKLIRCTKEDGILAITVPPINYSKGIVGGHVNLFTPEMLLYRMLLAGLDLSDANVIVWKWDIAVIVKKRLANLPDLVGGVGNRPELYEMREFLPPMTWTNAPLFDGQLKSVISK